MLKTIKRTKQMRLDELIKYVWENSISDKEFKSETNPHVIVYVTQDNNVLDNGYSIGENDLFPVEIEEEITEDTEFENVLTVLRDKFGLTSISYNTNLTTSIKKTIKNFEETNYKPLSVYALIDDKLELIHEVKDNNREE